MASDETEYRLNIFSVLENSMPLNKPPDLNCDLKQANKNSCHVIQANLLALT